ncbi:MAG: VOC family protein [Pseudomonadota bacterium]
MMGEGGASARGVFDHLVVACEQLETGAGAVETVLGVPLEPGGKHPSFGTHNRLLSLGEEAYLEVIAVDPGAPAPGRVRWYDLDRFSGAPRLTTWVVRVSDLDASQAQGRVPGVVLSLERGAYRWRMGVPEDGILPLEGMHPAVIAWEGPHPAAALPDRGVRLKELCLRHPEPGGLAAIPGRNDPRVTVERGLPALSARLTGPAGDRWL